jgi:hypothetical protein
MTIRLSALTASAAALALSLLAGPASAQPSARPPEATLLLVPDAVFDGTTDQPHKGWAVLVTGQRITATGPLATLQVPADRKSVV